MGRSPSAPSAPPPPPPPPDPFDEAVRSARAASRDQQLRARGRKSTLLTSAAGDLSPAPVTAASARGGAGIMSTKKTLLGQ
jgi:hypothetical protein